MKILFFVDSLIAGGKERRLIELMKGVKKNPEITFELVVMNADFHYQEVHTLNIKIHYLIRKSKKDLSVFKKFYLIAKEFKPNIVHCWDSMTAVIAVPACKLLNIYLVNGLVMDTPVQQNVLNKNWFRAKLTFPFSTVVIGNSEAGLQGYNAPKNKSQCVYNGLDLVRFVDLKSPSIIREEILGPNNENAFIVGMVAAFEDRKDYKTLIKAAIKLIGINENFRFLLIGDGADLISLKNQIPISLKDKIIFLGKRTNIEALVNIFNVGILLTNRKVHGEGISNSIIEYMALSKPVIATRGGGTNEVVFDNENGYLIDANNEDEVVEKLLILLNNKNLTDQFGNRGREMVLEKFDLRIMTKKYEKIYSNLL